MRPTYERSEDRRNEQRVVDVIRREYGLESLQLPPFAAADILVLNEDRSLRYWCEIKTRRIAFGTYRSLNISLDKVERLQRLEAMTKVPALIVANLTDGVFFHRCPIAGSFIETERGGRTDRGDAKDIETMACLSWDKFKRIGD